MDPTDSQVADLIQAVADATRQRDAAHGIEEEPERVTPQTDRILALDLSSRTGWAFYENKVLKEYGVLAADGGVLTAEGLKYPWSMVESVMAMKEKIRGLVEKFWPDTVVIEETNLGKQRYSQKFLEWLHFNVVTYLHVKEMQCGWPKKENVVYISTSAWRQTLGLKLTKSDQKNNRQVKAIKGDKLLSPKVKNKLLKELGVRGKKGPKHLSCAYVEDTHKIRLKVSTENDIADAICLGDAYIRGAPRCVGMEKD